VERLQRTWIARPFERAQQKQTTRTVPPVARQQDYVADNLVVGCFCDRHRQPVFHPLVLRLAINTPVLQSPGCFYYSL
jgi:hypothetical protein